MLWQTKGNFTNKQELLKLTVWVLKSQSTEFPQVVAPRTIGLNVQLTNAAGENVARCLICSAHLPLTIILFSIKHFKWLKRDDLNFTNLSAFRVTTPPLAAQDVDSSNRFDKLQLSDRYCVSFSVFLSVSHSILPAPRELLQQPRQQLDQQHPQQHQ